MPRRRHAHAPASAVAVVVVPTLLLLWQAPRYSNGIEGILVRGRVHEHAEYSLVGMGGDANGGTDNWAKTGIWTLQARVVVDCAAPPCVSVRDEENNEQSPALFVKAHDGDQKIATLHGAEAAQVRAHRCTRIVMRCTALP